MAEVSRDSWNPFAVGPYNPAGATNARKRLQQVSHVTHVQSALEVLRAGSLKPQLIYDESRLNTSRILVVWVSPNDWTNAGGFRYGNVIFDLDFPALIGGMKCYWVGVMEYVPQACRILITDQDRGSTLKVYTPESGDGPWVRNGNGTHAWNGTYCLELMVEQEISLDMVSGLRFAKHHQDRCSIDYATCGDRGNDKTEGAARFLAGAASDRLLGAWPAGWVRNGQPLPSLREAWDALKHLLPTRFNGWQSVLNPNDAAASAVARAAMGAFCNRVDSDRQNLIALFKCPQDLLRACATAIEGDLGLPNGTLPV